MTSREEPGLLRRSWTAFGAALKRGPLGRSNYRYMKQFTGGDAYWDNLIAAQMRRTEEPLAKI